ncbi:MAG TPA: chemotaxis protein CheA [Terriglobia bacterium]|nr:chemotaxis protein CheA [Terriglobia bacterium]
MEFDFEALIQTFKAEAEENLGRMEESLVALEDAPADHELLHTIFRVAHTLKGNAAALGFTGLTEFAHRLEDCLDRLQKGTAQAGTGLITALLKSVDAMRELLSSSLAGNVEMQDAHQELLKVLAEESGVIPRTLHPAEPAHPAAPLRNSPGRRKEDQTEWSERTRTLRVDIDKLDRMLNLTGEIAIARGRIRQMLAELEGRSGEETLEVQRDSDRLFLDLQELVMKIRMVPIGPTFRQHSRTVRDLATSSGKQARLEIEGEEVEVDTTVVNLIKDPLTHMLRNAVDHGLETPEARQAAGKDPCGLIRLKAFHDTGNIVIQISDDGAGLNRTRILEKARTRGLATKAEVNDSELFRLICEPGFSTADKVTDVSGRGVGMDVVRRNIEALRGTVTAESKEGAGTTLTIRLPLTLAIIEGFLVGVGIETYVLPLDVVVECVDLPESERGNGASEGIINLRGKSLPYVRMRHMFGGDIENSAREQIVVVQHHEMRAGLVVDSLYGENQIVIKPLGKIFQGLPGVSGSTILGNGRVALILDVPAIVAGLSKSAPEESPVIA